MRDPSVSVVIPSYNRRDCLLDLLSDLSQQGVQPGEVIVVDDASPDNTVQAIREKFPEVLLLVNEQNGGPCVSRNRGVREAKGEIILGLDSDVSLSDPNLVGKVKEAFERASDDLAGYAFRVYEPDGKTDDLPRWWHPLPAERFKDQSFETSYFSGTAYAFRREAMMKGGLYPEVLYMHYEEVELAFRMMDQDQRIEYCPELTVLHHANPVSNRSEIKVFYKPRNQILLSLRCYPALRGLVYLGPRLFKGFISSIFGGHTNRWLAACGSAIKLSPKCLRDRKPLSKRTWRRIGDLKQGSRK